MTTIGSSKTSFVYLKVYCDRSEVDGILLDSIAPLVHEFPELRNFFFLRYVDPEFHIRVRFYREKPQFRREDRERIRDLVASRIRGVPKSYVVIAPYRPEVVRYGGLAGVRLFERVSTLSSWAALKTIRSIREAGAARRIVAALQLNEALLESMGISLENRNRVYQRPVSPVVLESLSGLLEEVREGILKGILRPAAGGPIVENYFRELRIVFDALTSREREGLSRFVPSYIHLQFNRLGVLREHERVAGICRALVGEEVGSKARID